MTFPKFGSLLEVVVDRVFAEPVGTTLVKRLPLGTSLVLLGEPPDAGNEDENVPLFLALSERYGVVSIFYFHHHFEVISEP